MPANSTRPCPRQSRSSARKPDQRVRSTAKTKKPCGHACRRSRALPPLKQRQRQPCKAKLTEGHSTKFSKLRSDGRQRKREKYAILPASDLPPNFLERPRISPVHRRRAGGRPRQITVDKDQRCDRNQRSI